MSGWTDDRVEKLKKLYAEGHSASIIANRLGNVSRNAVIGKCLRLGLPPRRSTVNMTSNSRAMRKRMAPKPKTPFVRQHTFQPRPVYPVRQDVPLDNPVDIARVSFEAMDSKCHCRWPVGDPRKSDFGFCGHQPVLGQPYCEAHLRRAFRPIITRQESRPTVSDEIKINKPEPVEA